jgi:hypothetical protein
MEGSDFMEKDQWKGLILWKPTLASCIASHNHDLITSI